MASLEIKFAQGLFWKTLVIGVGATLLGAGLISWYFAGSILLGTLVSAFNMKVVAWVSRKMARAASSGDTGTTRWSLLLVLKLFLLFALTFIFIVILGANVFGYVIGYSTFLVAIVWQLFKHIGRHDPEGDPETTQEGDIESL